MVGKRSMIFDKTPIERRLSSIVTNKDSELSKSINRIGRKYPIGYNLGKECRADDAIFVLQHGWTVTYKIMRNGDRQILDLNVPGDVIGMRQSLFDGDDYKTEPITEIVAQKIPAEVILRALADSPDVAVQVIWATMSDSALAIERVVSMGRRDAPKRVAHFLLELGTRLERVGLATKNGYHCPLSQTDLADVLGMSAVHVNRVLRDLRERDMLTFKAGQVHFNDLASLTYFAEFEGSYMSSRPH